MVMRGEKLNIAVLAGTKRAQRQSVQAAWLVHHVGTQIEEIEVKLVDPNEFNFPGDGNDPVALAGASSRHWGGIRAIEALVGTVRELGLVATFTDVMFPNVQDLFDDQHQLLPEHREVYDKNIRAAYQELIWMARSLKWGRDNLK
jgi:NAD(P)H-dependent FMN reductase